jgi:hypothetical protein
MRRKLLVSIATLRFFGQIVTSEAVTPFPQLVIAAQGKDSSKEYHY